MNIPLKKYYNFSLKKGGMMSKQYSMKHIPLAKGGMFIEILKFAGKNYWNGCVGLSWKLLSLLMNICMNSAWTTVCIVKIRISRIQREMSRQQI